VDIPSKPKESNFVKSILRFLILVLLASPVVAEAQQVSGFVESWNTLRDGNVTPQMNVYATGPLKGKVGWSIFTLSSEKWSEGYGGLTLAPAKWIALSASLGIEAADNPIRGGTSLWIGSGKWAGLVIAEKGGSGYWYRYLGTYQTGKHLTLGVHSTRPLGVGPYAEFRIGKVSLWGTYAVLNKRGVMAARFYF